MKTWDLLDEQYDSELERYFKGTNKTGINEFIKHINF